MEIELYKETFEQEVLQSDDEEPDLTMQYNVSSIPTLMVFKNGQLVNKAVGYREKDEILKMLK